jgi:glycosyltransferase involved in cell wall biosynthesis
MAESTVRVAFDPDIFLRQRFGGISRMFVEMAKRLPQQGVEPRFVAPLHINAYLGELPTTWFAGGQRKVEHRLAVALARRIPNAWTRAAGKLTGASVVHETYYAPRRAAPKGVPVVITMYDMIHELYDDFTGDPVIEWKARAIDRADWITCISENTRSDMIRLFPASASKSSVVPLAADLPAPAMQPLWPRPCILYVGERSRPYKNFTALLQAFASRPAIVRDFDLVCIGGGSFSPDETCLIADAGLAQRVHQTSASDSDLATFYRHAGCLVYPSTYEGFGIPPLEAMGAGCPVIALRSASIPEVCGDAAHYAEDASAEALAAALERVLGDDALAAALRRDGHAQAARFGWERTAALTADVYRSLAGTS